MTSLLWGVGSALAGWALTGLVRRYAVSRSLLDIPNDRSAHVVPTPRGGGLAIVVVALSAVAAAAQARLIPAEVAGALLGGGALVAAVGWLDDRHSLSARWRGGAHAIAAAWAVAWLGGLPAVDIGVGALPLGAGGTVLAVLGIVWVTNLFNFMDGIDGLAAGEAVSVGLIGAALLQAGGTTGLALLALTFAAASAGFLCWNWPPARIFMGDVGSATLGYLFAVLALASERAGAVPLLAWGVLAAVFLFDATVTLIRRVYRREQWYQAHSSHAYQRSVKAGASHRRVTTSVLALNLALGGLATIGTVWPRLLVPAAVAAVAALTLVYRRVEGIRPMAPSPPEP